MLVTQLLRCTWVTVAAVIIASSPLRDAHGADASLCGELPCRANGVPYVTEAGTIVIFQGEKFWVELKIEGDQVVSLVPRKRETPNAILLEMVARGNASGLVWGNQLDRPVRFEATMTAPRRETLPTKPCPLPPKIYTYEVWNVRIETLEISNFRFTPADGAKCD